MFYIISALSVVLSLINPIFGIIVLLGFVAPEIVVLKKKLTQGIIPIIIMSFAVYFFGSSFLGLLSGLFLLSILIVFIKVFRNGFDLGETFFKTSIVIAVIWIAQYYLIGDEIERITSKTYSVQMEQIKNNYQQFETKLSLEQIELFYKKLVNFIVKYYTEIMLFSSGMGVFFGIKIFLKKIGGKYFKPLFVLPLHNTTMLLIGMVFLLIPELFKFGLMIMVAMIPMNLMQGFGVLGFYWRPFLKYFKYWKYLLYLVLFISPYALAAVAVVGAFDSWFDFRKLREKEESSGNHSY